MPPTASYEVKFEYCNRQDFTHKHTTAQSATQEYGKLLAEAIEPVGELSEALHLRLIKLSTFDENNELIKQVDSGVFKCSHRED